MQAFGQNTPLPQGPHKRGPFADGLLGDSSLVCPLHAWKFDLETGKTDSGPCSLKTYPARLSRAGQIVVEVLAAAARPGSPRPGVAIMHARAGPIGRMA